MSDAGPQTPTVVYDGVEIPDFGERRFPYATVEITQHCNLRCTTCYFFEAFQHEEKNLGEDELLDKLRALQKRHGIKFISWAGGEPLLRRRIIEAAPTIFEQNVMFTNGTLPIPDLAIAIGVSLDGPPAINDAIRGEGVYQQVVDTLREAPRPVFIQHVVTKSNAPYLREFMEGLTRLPNVTGAILSIYVPQQNETGDMHFDLPERDRLLNELLALKDEYGAFLMNERRALELMHSSTCKPITDTCDMKVNSLALDYRLNRRVPCCYGEDVDCDRCAAPTPFSIAARREQRAQQADGAVRTDEATLPEAIGRSGVA